MQTPLQHLYLAKSSRCQGSTSLLYPSTGQLPEKGYRLTVARSGAGSIPYFNTPPNPYSSIIHESNISASTTSPKSSTTKNATHAEFEKQVLFQLVSPVGCCCSRWHKMMFHSAASYIHTQHEQLWSRGPMHWLQIVLLAVKLPAVLLQYNPVVGLCS